MVKEYGQSTAEALYKDLMTAEAMPGFLGAEETTLIGHFKSICKDYIALSKICRIVSEYRQMLNDSKEEIKVLIEQYGKPVIGKKGILNRLERLLQRDEIAIL